jgi:branched-chain amino acid transport system permease protein
VINFFTFTIIGLTTGAIYAIAATGLVLTFTTSRIFNLAHGAMGMVLAFIFYQIWIVWHVPEVVSLVLSIFVIGPLLGWVLGHLVMRHLAKTPVTMRLMGTLSLFVLFQGAATVIWERDGQSRSLPGLVSDSSFAIGRVNVTWNQLTTVLVALLVAVLLWLFLHRTRLGTAMRAVVDNPDLAELMAISPNRIQNVSWGIGVSLAGLAAILIAPSIGLQQISALSLLVISAFAAAIIGRLASIGWTYVGGLALGIVSSLLVSYLPSTNEIVQALPQAMPFIILFVVLIIMRQEQQALQRQATVLADPPPPLRATITWCVLAIVGSVLIAPHLSSFMSLVVATGLVYSSILLSLVLLTGMAGQVSLCQFSFVGIGAALVAHLAPHMPYALAALIATVVTGVVGGLIALPALRLRGLYIALSTFAFALMCDDLLFQNSHVFGQQGQAIQAPAPSLFGLTARSNRSYVVVGAILVAVFAMGVQYARHGRFGRRMAALRDSPPAAAALGLSLVRAKVVVFAVSAAMAGLAGCIYGGLIGVIGGSQFTFLLSLTALLILAIQGLTAVPGAVLGGAFYALLYLLIPQWISTQWVVEILQPLGIGLAIISVVQHPEGAWTYQARVLRELRERHRAGTRPGPTVGVVAAGIGTPTSVGER